MAIKFAEPPIKEERQEKEMNKYQRGLVDTCFEEGQYESGIAILDQLRSSKYTPSESHIRQLLYIALYPPPVDKGKEKETPDPASPSKLNPARQQKSPLIPSPAATEAAHRLLLSFVNTNTPARLFRAIPECSLRPRESRLDGDDDEDSYLAREALCITQCRHCWAILKEGFIVRKRPVMSTPKGKGKRKQQDFLEDEVPTYRDSPEAVPIVAENAWPVLEWLVSIFEQDELQSKRDGQPQYSPLLLSQIPPSRGASSARWEADIPLDIAFYCLKQTDQRKQALGMRLVITLINLTSTTLVDMQIFVNLIFARLSSTTPDEFSTFLSTLPPSPPGARCKVALCRKFLTEPSSGDSTRPAAVARPQARAVRAARRSAADHEDSSVQVLTKPAESTSIVRQFPLLPSEEVLRILQTGTAQNDVRSLRIKFELLVAYAMLQRIDGDADSAWLACLKDGSLRSGLLAAFGGEDGRMFREVIEGLIPVWSS
ncbi:hypothetical protein PLICRDRAFT_37703 [Plicaturopsis crispa FD-325 SS-3]|nr:hypothetical protein PLICRDRAFT_37703 [Plicaturopsis crispa FD-325 SS-3]